MKFSDLSSFIRLCVLYVREGRVEAAGFYSRSVLGINYISLSDTPFLKTWNKTTISVPSTHIGGFEAFAAGRFDFGLFSITKQGTSCVLTSLRSNISP